MKINLLKNYPSTKRNLTKRNSLKSKKFKILQKNLGKIILMVKENMDMVVITIIKNFGKK